MDGRIGFCCRVLPYFRVGLWNPKCIKYFYFVFICFRLSGQKKKKEVEKPSAMVILPEVVVWSQLMHFSLPHAVVGKRCFFRSTYFLWAV